jgi:hypothetical protein
MARLQELASARYDKLYNTVEEIQDLSDEDQNELDYHARVAAMCASHAHLLGVLLHAVERLEKFVGHDAINWDWDLYD